MFDKERFKSFAERYVVQRAIHFTQENEAQEAWAAVERAKMLYRHIAEVGERLLLEDREQSRDSNAAMAGQATSGRVVGKHAGLAMPYSGKSSGATHLSQVPVAPSVFNSQAWTGRKTP